MPKDETEGLALFLEGPVLPDDYATFFHGPCISPGSVRAALSEMAGDIRVRINSRGGDPVSAEAIRVMLLEHDGHITGEVVGEACSSASLLIMGADTIVMSQGSIMMIHNPSTFTEGDAKRHLQTVNRLQEMERTYAQVYANRAGIPLTEMLALMADELWMGPEEAVNQGFADDVLLAVEHSSAPTSEMAAQVAATKAQFIEFSASMARLHEQFHRARTMSADQPAQSGQPMAAMAEQEAVDMPKKPDAAAQAGTEPETQAPDNLAVEMAAQEATRQERERRAAVVSMARPHVAAGRLSPEAADTIADSGVSVEMAASRILDALADQQPDVDMTTRPAVVGVQGHNERDTRRAGMAAALTAQLMGSAVEDECARPYMAHGLADMAAEIIGAEPLNSAASFSARSDVLMSAASHTSGDFPHILNAAVNAVLVTGYEAATPTFGEVSREMEFADFKAHDLIDFGSFPMLKPIAESGEIKFGTVGEAKESAALASYASGFTISRQALVNDSLGALRDLLSNAATIIPDFEEQTFWSFALGNPKMASGTAMFHSDHGNLGTAAAISVTSVSAGRKALRAMKGLDGRPIVGNAPSVLLVGPELETVAEQFLATGVVPTKGEDQNPFAGKLKPVVCDHITDKSWYLAVGPDRRTANFRHGYLRGAGAPRIRVENVFGRQGTSMTLEHDFGVGAAGVRGAWKNPGQ